MTRHGISLEVIHDVRDKVKQTLKRKYWNNVGFTNVYTTNIHKMEAINGGS